MIKRLRYYYSRFGLNGVLSIIKAKFFPGNDLIQVKRKDIKFPFCLRYKTSDIPTYDQVFLQNEYDFIASPPPKTIIDAGANIGLASIYFANRYPEATIIAIEPELSNFELLSSNVKPYKNITPLNVALWNSNEKINLMDPGLGKWGFMTQEDNSEEDKYGDVCHIVQGITVDKIIDDYGLDRISILKIDIEGAEREVFMDPSRWLDKVDSLIVELHERMKPGCNRVFYNGTNGFDAEWQLGENVYLSRGNSLARKPVKL